MKVATFIVRIRVEDFDEDILKKKAKLMEQSGSVSVSHEQILNEDWGEKAPAVKV